MSISTKGIRCPNCGATTGITLDATVKLEVLDNQDETPWIPGTNAIAYNADANTRCTKCGHQDCLEHFLPQDKVFDAEGHGRATLPPQGWTANPPWCFCKNSDIVMAMDVGEERIIDFHSGAGNSTSTVTRIA